MRVDYRKAFPAGFRAMAALERAVYDSTLEPGLLELVKIRASQINGCTYCLAMHTRDARARGEHQTRHVPETGPARQGTYVRGWASCLEREVPIGRRRLVPSSGPGLRS